MRLFLALTLPEAAVDLLSEIQDEAAPDGTGPDRADGARLVPVANLHLTLAFLGDLPDGALEAVDGALRSLRAPEIPLTFSGGAGFGGRRNRAVALGADGGAALRDLHDSIRSRLHGAGLVLERRRFRPHVTLLRVRTAREAARALAKLPPGPLGPFLCDSFGLFSSELHRDGARHEELARYMLGAVRGISPEASP